MATPAPGSAGVVDRTVQRSLAGRAQTYADEVHRIVTATYRVVERTGSLDPTVRAILKESGVSRQTFYRHFPSKDALLVALLDDGRRQIADYLRRRMAKTDDLPGRVRAWVEGVLAQAADPAAAGRTRPFLANLDRLNDGYPDEQRASAAAMVAPLEEALAEAGHPEAEQQAHLVYLLAVAAMHEHIRDRGKPSPRDVERLVAFCLRALGIADTAPGRDRRRVRATSARGGAASPG
jgi:AcrR family transcriptional regulator